MVWLWAYGFWAYVFRRMVLGVWFWGNGFGCMALGVWFGFGSMVMGVGFWAYGCGRIVWTNDFGGTALQTRAGKAQKYIPILNRKIKD